MLFKILLIGLILYVRYNCVQCYGRHSSELNVVNGEDLDCHYSNNCPQTATQSQTDYQTNYQDMNDCQNQFNCQNTGWSHKSRQQHSRGFVNHRYDSRSPHQYRHHSSESQTQSSLTQLISMTALQVWKCEFDVNDCGIHNQYNMKSYFTLMLTEMGTVFGRKGLLYLDLVRAQSSGARLITPYFPTNGCRYGCLSIEYILCGHSIENLYVIQQDVRNYCVWQKRNDRSYRWQTSSLTIDLSRSNPRFFIEVRFNPLSNSNRGFIGISEMNFKYGECEANESNDCDLNQFIGIIN